MAKDTCEASKRISIKFLKEHKYLSKPLVPKSGSINWSWGGEPSGSASMAIYPSEGFIRFSYTRTYYGGEKEDFNYEVRLVTTPCHFGGERYWFVCPLSKNQRYCGKKVGVLYLAGNYFGCRTCYDLAYQSQQQTHTGFYGAMSKILFNGFEEKENAIRVKFWKGKPTKRYQRLLNKSYANIPFSKKMAMYDLLDRRLTLGKKEVI